MNKTGHKVNHKKWIQIVLLTGCVLMTLLTVYYVVEKRDVGNEVGLFSVKTMDGKISVNWDLSLKMLMQDVSLVIEGENITYSEKIIPFHSSYSFQNGNHGEYYRVAIVMDKGTDKERVLCEKQALFLNYKELPDIPTLVMDTVSGEDPAFETIVSNGTNQIGSTIYNNYYETGNMSIYHGATVKDTVPMKIRVRGNTSATDFEKSPYKLVLDTKKDLLELGDSYANKEWILLSCGTDMNNYLGTYISNYLGSEWQPEVRFVNVMLNGDWKGLYILTEPVVNIADALAFGHNGFMIENDAYWWSPNTVYFQTDRQRAGSGIFFRYTFKYPEITEQDELYAALNSYMEEVESYVSANDDEMYHYIDKNSFVTWILTKDVLGHIDPAGSNMFLYSKAFDSDDYQANLLKIGPVYDFDGAFYQLEQLSLQHNGDEFWYPDLFENQTFQEAYCEKWHQVSDKLYGDVDDEINDFLEDNEDAINESRRLDSIRWNRPYREVADELDNIEAFLYKQIEFMDKTTMEMEESE